MLVFGWWFACSLLSSEATEATDKAADFENLRQIGQALTAFQKAKGQYPDYLSDLVPKFLDASTLVSPLGAEGDPHAAKGEYDPKLPCSYSYEFGARKFPNSDRSFRALKALQLQELGPTVPIVRCFLHGPETLNLSHAGDLFAAPSAWEFDNAEVPPLLKKNGPGPGIREGKRLVVTVTDEAGHPIPGLVVRASPRLVHGFSLPMREDPTDAEGKVIIPLGASEQARVDLGSASPDWYLPSRVWSSKDDPTPPDQMLVPLRLIAEPAGTMGGVVRDATGAPVAGARLIVFTEPKPGQTVFLGLKITDAGGAWSTPSIPKKNLSLQLDLHHRGSRWITGAPGTHGLPTAAALFTGHAEIRLEPPFPVPGTVRFEGQPVEGVTVCVDARFASDSGQATTDATGQFKLRLEAEDKYTLLFVANGLAPKRATATLTPDMRPLAVEMDAGHPVRGRILKGPRTPIANAPVLFVGFPRGEQPPPNGVQPVIATTDAEGSFTWAHAPKDSVVCAVFPPDGGDAIKFELDATQENAPDVHLGP